MKILVVSQYFWPENFRINDICDGLIERGHAVDVLTSLPNVPQGSFYDGYGWFHRGEKVHNGVNVRRVGVISRGKTNKLRWVLNCASFAVNSLFHLPALGKNDYDAVFVFNNSPVSKILPAKVFSAWKKIPNVIFILDIWPESMFFLVDKPKVDKSSLFYRLMAFGSKWLYKSGDTLLISSKGFEKKLRDMGLTSRITFFPNYAEKVETVWDDTVTRESLGLSQDDFIYGFAGNIGPAQALDLLVESAALCRDDAHIKYLIMGTGPSLDDIRSRIREKGLEDRFVFTGWVDPAKLPNYLRLSDSMLLMLKDNEVLNLTVPAKLQTYMHEKKPVLAFMNGAGAETVTESGCGIAVPAEDVEALANALRSMADLPAEELRRMGEAGERYGANAYDREQVLDLLEAELRYAIEHCTR